ncbi:hypothetical protein D4R52_03895 [bacterium]|nr:MAG: hypothetical protein D4R52_03895 [bacterium]
MKRKKIATGEQQVLTARPNSQPQIITNALSDSDVILDNLVRFAGEFGYRQVVFPPIEERKFFAQAPAVQKYYGDNFLGLSGSDKDLVFSPTHFLGALKLYRETIKGNDPRIAKWFYVLPVAAAQMNPLQPTHEFGIFILGEHSGLASAQMINTVTDIYRRMGLVEFTVEITSRGCGACQKEYADILQDFASGLRTGLCDDCEENFKTNPLAVFDCAEGTCQETLANSPQFIDFLDEGCRNGLRSALETIDDLGIPYSLASNFTHPLFKDDILFRIVTPDSADGKPLGYGGSYSHWAKMLGLPTGAIGFISSFEELAKILPLEKRKPAHKVEVFLMALGVQAARKAMVMYRDLQGAGIKMAESILGCQGIRHQLKEAEGFHPEIALIIGQKEAVDGTVILRDVRSGMQEVFAGDRIIEEVKKRLGK